MTDKEKLQRLYSWQDFYDEISSMDDEEELAEYYNLERQHYKRSYVLLRIYGRMNVLRTRREREEIKKKYGRSDRRR